MDREMMLQRVMTYVDFRDREEADRAIRAMLLALADGISRDEAHDMGSQLPKEYKDLVMGRLGEAGPVQTMNWGTLVGRVQTDLGLQTPEAAERVIRGVFAALKDAVSPGEMEDVAAEMPLDLREALRRA